MYYLLTHGLPITLHAYQTVEWVDVRGPQARVLHDIEYYACNVFVTERLLWVSLRRGRPAEGLTGSAPETM